MKCLELSRVAFQAEDREQFAVLFKGLLATHHVYVALQVIFFTDFVCLSWIL